MPQLAPMPWVTLFLLMFLYKSLIFTSLWSHRPPQFSLPLNQTSKLASHNLWPWS